MNNDDLFGDVDPATIASINRQYEADLVAMGQARAVKRHTRHQMRRATAEARLVELLPATFADGESWHVISQGDIDALSYLKHAIDNTSHFDQVLLSTWCIATEDMTQLQSWLDAGKIDQLTLCVGEIFPGSYTAEYQQALAMEAAYGTRLIVAKNHSKVTLCANHADAYYLAIESSANVNTNPRVEQTSIHASRDLYEFYLEFFHGLRSIDKRA